MAFHSEIAENLFRPPHDTEEIENATITDYCGFVFEENSGGKYPDDMDFIVFYRSVFLPQ